MSYMNCLVCQTLVRFILRANNRAVSIGEYTLQISDTISHPYSSQDLAGKFLSVIGGSLVIRGWSETSKRYRERQGLNFLETANFLPWAQEKSSECDEEEVIGSRRVQRKPGAAKVPNRPPKLGNEQSSSKSDKQEANQGLFARLWPSSDSSMNPTVKILQWLGWSKDDSIQEAQRKSQQKSTEEGLRKEKDHHDETDNTDMERKDEPPELVLAIHGIGQKLTEDFDALDFVYDIERLRNLSKSLANDEDIKKMSKGKRVQFLPICWRKELSFDDTEAKNGNDNLFALRDISNDATIPMVRNVISKVILDVPYYLSRHKKTMVQAVIDELNRVYRLFVKRNPDFERRNGRVSLICHSLGSALAADILSNQPTFVPPLNEQSRKQQNSQLLCFNVKHLIFVGSPNGFFFHLNGFQLIARRGTQRTKDTEPDAARDDVGRGGCLAAEAVYNCYNVTDPVAFQLSATVDREYASMLRPISLSDAVPALVEALSAPRLSLSKYFSVVHPFAKVGDAAIMEPNPSSQTERHSRRENNGQHTPPFKRPVLVEKGTAQKEEQLKTVKKRATSRSCERPSDFDFPRLERAERR